MVRLASLASALLGASIVVAVPGTPAHAVPGTPGVPQDPVPVYSEDFSSGTAATTPVPVNAYTGGPAANGETYTADPPWLPPGNGGLVSSCDGWIMSFADSSPTTQDPTCGATGGIDGAGNSQTAWWYQQRMADVIGLAQGQSAAVATTNHAITSMTNSLAPIPAGQDIQFQTVQNATRGIAGHYYRVSAYFAAVHCLRDRPGNQPWVDASETLDLMVNGVPTTVTSGFNPCLDEVAGSPFVTTNNTRVRVGRAVSTTPIRLTADAQLGLRLRNATTSSTGNDIAFDLPEIEDITPQLDKSFAPAAITADQTSTLTFTITNTTDLLAKTGWMFTDVLPGDLIVTPGTTPTTTCPNGAVTVPDGGTRLSVTGDLTQGMTSCTVTVSITPPGPGTYVNGPSDVTTNGVLPPGSTTLVVTPAPEASLHLTKTSTPFTVTAAGQTVTFTYEVTNNGNQPVTFTGINETSFSGTGPLDVSCPDAPILLAPAGATTCSATYQVTAADLSAGPITNLAEAVGTGPGGAPVTSPPARAHVDVAHLVLVKTASPVTVHAGTTVTYSFTVTNTGNVAVGQLRIREESFTGSGSLSAITCPVTTLAAGAQTTCTARYTVTPRDADRGSIHNAAVALGAAPDTTPVQSSVSAATLTTPGPLTVKTHTSAGRVTPGQRLWDRVHVSGLGGVRARVTARLYGPFSSSAEVSCRPAAVARTVAARVTSGWNRLPEAQVAEPGIYTWRATVAATVTTSAGTHRCGVASETTTVAKPAFRPPIINGGFSGTLPDRPLARGTLPRIEAPGFGLRAPVVGEGVRHGRMRLPSVGAVGWLRESAGIGDRIGTTVIGGHVSDRHDRPGAMVHLSHAKKGQVVTVKVGGQTFRYRVASTFVASRGHVLPHRFFATTGRPRLVLVSCTDRVVFPNGHFHYTDYQVVVANLV
jgi:hypothetical protein